MMWQLPAIGCAYSLLAKGTQQCWQRAAARDDGILRQEDDEAPTLAEPLHCLLARTAMIEVTNVDPVNFESLFGRNLIAAVARGGIDDHHHRRIRHRGS